MRPLPLAAGSAVRDLARRLVLSHEVVVAYGPSTYPFGRQGGAAASPPPAPCAGRLPGARRRTESEVRRRVPRLVVPFRRRWRGPPIRVVPLLLVHIQQQRRRGQSWSVALLAASTSGGRLGPCKTGMPRGPRCAARELRGSGLASSSRAAGRRGSSSRHKCPAFSSAGGAEDRQACFCLGCPANRGHPTAGGLSLERAPRGPLDTRPPAGLLSLVQKQIKYEGSGAANSEQAFGRGSGRKGRESHGAHVHGRRP